MTKEEALKIIDQVLAQVSLNRAGHEKLKEAMNVLSRCEEINEQPKVM